MSINPKEIAFAVITYYPKWYNGNLRSLSETDKIRGDLALKFIQKIVSKGFRLVIVDGKSSKSFRRQLVKYKDGVKIIKRRVIEASPSKRQAFNAASKFSHVKVIIATEPEKISIIDYVTELTKPVFMNEVEVVVPKRDDKLFKKTYPDYMYESEVEGNKIYNQQLRIHHLLDEDAEDFDMFFGPKVFINSPKILNIFKKNYLKSLKTIGDYFNPEKYSNTVYFPVVVALKKGYKVKSLKVPFRYPKLQKLNESIGARNFFMEKRRNQKLAVLLELMYLLTYFQIK